MADSVFLKILKLLVISLHMYHEKLKGAVPPGLLAIRVPFCDPEALQYINTGSLTAVAEGYEVYLTAFIPGAVSWASQVNGNITPMIRKK